MSMPAGLVGVLGRISELQSLVGTPAPAATAATTTAATTGAGASSFADVLADTLDGGDVVADARRYLGTPYVWGGTDPATGLDCSGLVQRVFKDLGIALPRVSGDQAGAGTAVPSLAQARPGDILAFGHPVHHVGIYVGNGQMIDAPQPGQDVKLEKVWETPSAIRRVIPAQPQGVPADPMVRPAALTGSVPYGPEFAAAGRKHGLPASLLAAVAKVESDYDPRAVSPAGARGLMQIMPGTAAGLGIDPMDPSQAIDGAARLLGGYLRDFGSLPLALAAYNAGPGAVRRYGDIPPYQETQSYVRKVQAAMAALGSGA
jgi:peptidoglycan DL-endopeptidase CwlO